MSSSHHALRSLCLRTDIFLTAFDGEVIARDRYLVLRTPSNPGFWWGNFLLYPEPPHALASSLDASDSWLADFTREFPTARATLLAWDRPDGACGDDLEPFVRAGFAIDEGTVLTTTEVVRPARMNGDVTVDAIATDEHWADAARVLTNAFGARRSGTLEELQRFVARQLTRYRAMQDRSLGQWYAARIDGVMAAVLGIVKVPTDDIGTVGRFQLVGTDPAFARQGACSTLVYEVAQRALVDERMSTLVMAADANYHAARVYESVGFRATERLVALLRKPAKA